MKKKKNIRRESKQARVGLSNSWCFFIAARFSWWFSECSQTVFISEDTIKVSHCLPTWPFIASKSSGFSALLPVLLSVNLLVLHVFSLPSRFRAFESGVLVIQALSHSDEEVIRTTKQIVSKCSHVFIIPTLLIANPELSCGVSCN